MVESMAVTKDFGTVVEMVWDEAEKKADSSVEE